jgi:hypothetical protein
MSFAIILFGVGTIHRASADGCDVFETEYALSANLRVRGTTMGAGDGDYRVGPGKVVLRFSPGENGDAGPSVRLVSYAMRQNFTVVSKALFWETRILTDVETRTVPDPRQVVAEGVLRGQSIQWKRIVGIFRDDGTLDCDGTFCGKFGAPAPGRSAFHMAPLKTTLAPFEFSPDMKTFAMPYALSSKSEDPAQETYIALGGREVKRVCLASPAP